MVKKTEFTDEDVMAVANVVHLAWCREETNIPDESVQKATQMLWEKAFVIAREFLESVHTPDLTGFEGTRKRTQTSLPDILNTQARLACKRKLTHLDLERLEKLNAKLKSYQEHPLGEIMWSWHDLACEWAIRANHLDLEGQQSAYENSKSRLYREKAEDVRLKIEAEKEG